MTTATNRLTDKLVSSALTLLGDKKQFVFYDGEVKGFGLRVTKRGARSWVLNYRSRGIQRQLTIGSFPDWPAALARREAMRLKRFVDQGRDPQAERQADHAAPTVNDLSARYLAEYAPRKRPTSRHEDASLIARWIKPELGNRKVADLRHADVEQLHRKISAYGTPIRANRAAALLSKMFSLAIRWEMRGDNPARGLERNQENKRERYLDGDELRRLLDALAVAKDPAIANAIRLLLLTGARRGEVLGASWDQFDLVEGVWTKPAAMTKQKRLHRVPLSPPARQILDQMKAAAGDSLFLFPDPRNATGHVVEIKNCWASICAQAGLSDLHVHDLRHTFASVLASSGLSLPIIGRLLGHTQPGTTARYAHLCDDPLRAATERAGAILYAGRDDAPQAEIIELDRRSAGI